MLVVKNNSAFGKRLFKNKGASIGLILIVCNLLLAVFAYFLSPDHSANANRIIAEIGSKQPGFTIYVLRLPKEYQVATSFFSQLINGTKDNYQLVPISTYQLKGDSLVYQKFVDDGITEQKMIKNTVPISKNITKQTFYLGTDKFGRDILSRLIVGTRVSLGVGLIAVIISLSVGIFLGAIAGYFKGWVDDMVMWVINVIWSIPTLLLVFAITLVLGKGFWQVFIAVGLTMWVNVARLVRGQVLAVRELEYIEASRALGYSHIRTIVKHILPNILGPVIVIAASNLHRQL